MLKIAIVLLAVLTGLYVGICLLAYVLQERLIFFPDLLDKKHRFGFAEPFEEVFVRSDDGKELSALLFKAPNSKGVIFYLHGNAGSLDVWGDVAPAYLRLSYDVFLFDYRGYGKSEGAIGSEEQLVRDVQQAYDHLLQFYQEKDVIVLGYSLGSGIAAKIAAANNPRLLILQAPYYSLISMMRHSFPFLPTFLLKYKLRTDQALPACRMPVVLFHGDQDEVIPYEQAVKLKALLKPGDTLITLPGLGHNGMTWDPLYNRVIGELLSDNRK